MHDSQYEIGGATRHHAKMHVRMHVHVVQEARCLQANGIGNNQNGRSSAQGCRSSVH